MKVPITVPETVMPKKDPEHPCPCQDKPVRLEYKTCLLMWCVPPGAAVKEDEVVCEGEVEKKAFEVKAPASGILAEQCLNDDDTFSAGSVLGYIETEG